MRALGQLMSGSPGAGAEPGDWFARLEDRVARQPPAGFDAADSCAAGSSCVSAEGIRAALPRLLGGTGVVYEQGNRYDW